MGTTNRKGSGFRDGTPRLRNQMETKIEDEMETGSIWCCSQLPIMQYIPCISLAWGISKIQNR